MSAENLSYLTAVLNKTFKLYGMKISMDIVQDWFSIVGHIKASEVEKALKQHMQDEKHGRRSPVPLDVIRLLGSRSSSSSGVEYRDYYILDFTTQKPVETVRDRKCLIPTCEKHAGLAKPGSDDWYCGDHYFDL